jgi:membrane protein required for beta-lactamase induction
MALIVILICLALQRYWRLGFHFSRARWLKAYLRVLHPLWGKSNFWYSLGGIIVLLLPLPILAGIIDLLLKNKLFSLLQLFFQLGIVWFCLNAYDYRGQSSDYREILLQTGYQLFGVLFWYLLLGPAGAVGYTVVLLLAHQNFNEMEGFRPAAQQLLDVLAWAPLRIVALVYILAGHFTGGWHYCRQYLFRNPSQNNTFITEAGLAALGHPSLDSPEQTLEGALQLTDRTLFIVLVFLAIFTLGGWVK